MAAEEARAELRAPTRTLLDPEAGAGAQREAALRLAELCARWAAFDLTAPAGGGRALAHGFALDPVSAARCTHDFARTARFLQGVRAAVEAATARFGAPVDLLYAGCGPFAPLVLPLVTVLPAGAARVTLLDAHEAAIDALRRLVAVLGAEAWIAAFTCADALEWRAPRPPHVVVVEAMQKALAREPQVELMRRLAPQVAAGGWLLPREVALEACLADLRAEVQAQIDDLPLGAGSAARVPLGSLLRVSADALQRGEPLRLDPVRLEAPDYAGAARHLVVTTRVRVWDAVELSDYDSGITYPTVVHEVGRVPPGTRLVLRYELGREPGVRCAVAGAG